MSVWVRGAVIATALVTVGVTGAAPAAASLPKHAKRLTVHAGHTISNVDASLTEGSAIAGQVTDVDSNPLSDAQVEVLTAKGQVLGYTSTDDSGEYRAVGLPPSTRGYAVCVSGTSATSTARPVAYGYVAQCNGSAKPWSGFEPPSDARFVPTMVSQASTANLILTDGGAITGKVTSRSNGGKVNASGYLFSAGGHGEGSFSVSDGAYTASSLAPGKYVVCFTPPPPSKSHPGYVPQCDHDTTWPPDSPPPGKAKTVTVTSGAATEVDQSLPAGTAVSGRVRNAKTRSAVPAVVVVFAHGRTLSVDTPDRQGTYDIGNLPVETVDVCAIPLDRALPLPASQAVRSADRPATATWSRFTADAAKAAEIGQCWKNTPWDGRRSVPHAARELHLRSGRTTSGIDLAVARKTFRSHIAGHVGDAAGGLRNAGVAAFLPNGRFVASTTSGKGGAYRLNLPASKKGYLVCAGLSRGIVQRADARRDPARSVLGFACWRRTAWNGASLPPSSARRVTVASGHTASGVDITLPKTGAIAGTVTYQDAAVPNLSVTAFDPAGDYVSSAQTDAQGRYELTGLSPAKNYLVCFSTQYLDVSALDPDYGLRPQCYSDQAWDGLNS